VRRIPAYLLVTCLLASACQEALPAPPPGPAPGPAPSTSAPPPSPLLEERIPVTSDLRVDLPPNTSHLDTSGGTLFGMRYMVDFPRGFHLVSVVPPAHEWRTIYTSAADGTMTADSIGDDAQRTFVELTFGRGAAAFEVVTVDLATGTARRLDRSMMPSPLLAGLSQRARPTVIGNGVLVAWTRVRTEGDGFVWELYETTVRDPNVSPRLVRRSAQPLVPLAFDGRLAYAVVGPDRDELWIYDRTNGLQAAWPTTGTGITGAAWSEAGLVVAKIDVRAVGATTTIVISDDRGVERPIVNSTPCARLAVSGRYLTWSCSGGTDLRAYDLRTGSFPLVTRSPRTYDFHVSGDSFVWTEVTAGKSTARVLVLLP